MPPVNPEIPEPTPETPVVDQGGADDTRRMEAGRLIGGALPLADLDAPDPHPDQPAEPTRRVPPTSEQDDEDTLARMERAERQLRMAGQKRLRKDPNSY